MSRIDDFDMWGEAASEAGEPVARLYHAHDGLYFQRLDSGAVVVSITEDGDPPEEEGENVDFSIELDADTWASVIASMSAAGEENGGFYAASDFHTNPDRPAHPGPVE